MANRKRPPVGGQASRKPAHWALRSGANPDTSITFSEAPGTLLPGEEGEDPSRGLARAQTCSIVQPGQEAAGAAALGKANTNYNITTKTSVPLQPLSLSPTSSTSSRGRSGSG